MKANELMIGDWVEYSSKYKHGIGKIAGIEPREGSTEPTTFTVIDDNLMLIGVSKVNVKPIPLTPEILEKNGFNKYDGGYKIFKSNDENYYFGFESIFFNEEINLLNVTKETCKGKQTSIKGYFNYVHELQHALRLCGIEKQIEL